METLNVTLAAKAWTLGGQTTRGRDAQEVGLTSAPVAAALEGEGWL